MDARSFKKFQSARDAYLSGVIEEDHEKALTGKQAMQKALGRRRPLSEWDLSTADRDCLRCNGTGIIKHTRLYATSDLVTIVCNCVEYKAQKGGGQ